MQHFNITVPAAIKNKIKSVAEYAQENYINEHGEQFSDNRRIEEISGIAYSGFIPFQDGGYSANAWYVSDENENRTKAEQEFQTSQAVNCFDSFCVDFNIDNETSWNDLSEEQQEEYSEYERDWFSDGAWMSLDIYCRTGHGNYSWQSEGETGVFVHLKLNFRDAEYGRDKYADTLYEKQYTFAEFRALTPEQIIAAIIYE